MVTFLLIVLILAVVGVGTFAISQKKRTDELEQKLAQKKDDIAPYLELLGSIPAENWNDFMRNPAQVTRALGIVVERHAVAEYNQQRVSELLQAARHHRGMEMHHAKSFSLDSSFVKNERTAAERFENEARELDRQQNRLTQ